MKKYAPYALFRDNYIIINSIKKGRTCIKIRPTPFAAYYLSLR